MGAASFPVTTFARYCSTDMTRRLSLRSLAKVNLDIRVLQKREDGFHELRTVFQTISLADTIEIEYQPARRTELTVDGNVEIPDNLVLHSARAILDALRLHAKVHFHLKKRIPLGGGLGGGSSNAAAVLLAIPVLAGPALSMGSLLAMASGLGSDVPYFLTGGAAVGVGRGTELYELPDLTAEEILVVSPSLHIATGPAYEALGRGLTFTESSRSISNFQAFVRTLGESRSAGAASALSENHFEAVVYGQYPQLKAIESRLRSPGVSGASAIGAGLTGSGSAVFAIYRSKADRERARDFFERDRVFQDCGIMPAKLVSRRSYRRLWRRQLREHIADENLWPPRSRYAR